MFSDNIKEVDFKFNETYRSMDVLEKNITIKNKAFFEDYKSFCQELQIENKNEIDDLNKNVEKLESSNKIYIYICFCLTFMFYIMKSLFTIYKEKKNCCSSFDFQLPL